MPYFMGMDFNTRIERNSYVYQYKEELLGKAKFTAKTGCFLEIVWGILIITLFSTMSKLGVGKTLLYFVLITISLPILWKIGIEIRRSHIHKYAEDNEEYLTRLQEQIRSDILDPYFARYYTPTERMLHLPDLINLINCKKDINLSTLDGNFLLETYQKESIRNIYSAAISKLAYPDAYSLAQVFIKATTDQYLKMTVARQYFLDLFYECLRRKSIPFSEYELMKKIESMEKLKNAKDFEEKLQRDPSRIITVDSIEHLNGFEFEELIGDVFRKAGYKVTVTKKSGDQGADLVVEREGISTAVQTKKYTGTVGNTAVQEVVAAMKYYDCDKSIVITTGHFTKSAYELANRNQVRLIDREQLNEFFDNVL